MTNKQYNNSLVLIKFNRQLCLLNLRCAKKRIVTTINKVFSYDKFSVLFIVLFIALFLSSKDSLCNNQQKIDSLENELVNLTDSQRVDMLNKLAYLYKGTSSGKVLEYGKKALELSRVLGYKQGEADALKITGLIYFSLSDYDNSINYFFRSIKLMKKIDDKKGISECLNSIGNIYFELNKTAEALEYYKKSLEIKNNIGDKISIALTLNNIGVVFLKLGENDKALDYFKKSLKLKNIKGDSIGMSYTFNNIGFAYFMKNNFLKALQYYNKSLDIRRNIGTKKEIAVSFFNIGEVYIKINNFSEANNYLTKSLELAKETDTKILIKKIYFKYADLYYNIKDYKQAFKYHVLYSKINNNIYNKESSLQIAKMQTLFETEKKEKEIELLNKEKKIQNNKYTIQRIVVFSIIFILILVIFLALAIYNRFLLKQKANVLLFEKNNQLKQQKEEIQTQNEELETHRNHLEKLVKKRTSELEIAKEKAEESDRLKSAFLANMSHEIRTPMNAIIGFANIIADPYIDDVNKKELVSLINFNSKTLLHLIDDIIDISKIESGQLIIDRKICNLNTIFSELLKLYNNNKKDINKDNVILKFTKGSDYKDILIYYDPTRIKQIISNLIDNALKFTEKGYIEMGYIIENNLEKPRVKVFIKDTGIGISKDQQAKIFSRFIKVENNRKKLYNGAGLGLSISKTLVNMHGGEIWLESELNKGSTFYFTIPYRDMSEKSPVNK